MLEKKTELKLKKRKRGENNYLIAIGSIPCSHFFLRFFLFYWWVSNTKQDWQK